MATSPKGSSSEAQDAPQKTTRSARQEAVGSESGLDLMEWFQANSRLVGIALAVIAVAGAGYWFYVRSVQIKTANAERALLRAQQSLVSGNQALAQTDLQSVITRYDGTSAGTEAALLLAQLLYGQGKYQEGITALQKVVERSAATTATVHGLIGDGYSQLGKATDAAKAYERAGDVAEFTNEKAYYRAKAARSFATGGNVAEARRLWTELSKNGKAEAVQAEAKVRLAELNAKKAS